MARNVVTGGEGFIGRHLVAALCKRGDEVIVIGRPGSTRGPVPQVSDVLRIDLTDRPALDALFATREVDAVYHLAARTRRRSAADFSDWTDSVAEDLAALVTLVAAAAAAKRPPRVLVRTGSIAEYGAAPLPYRETGPVLPDSAYGAALSAGTTYMLAMAPSLPFPVATARLALTYGPGQSPDFLAAKLLTDLPRGLPVMVSRPEDRRTLVYIDDAVRALLRLAEHPIQLVNIATEDVPSMRELAHLVAELSGADPALLRFGSMAGPPVTLRSDTQLARSALGWTAQYDLRAGVAHCLARMRVECLAS